MIVCHNDEKLTISGIASGSQLSRDSDSFFDIVNINNEKENKIVIRLTSSLNMNKQIIDKTH